MLCPSPIEVLPEIAEAAGGRLAIMMDSGIRLFGTDVVRVLCAGASFTFSARAFLYRPCREFVSRPRARLEVARVQSWKARSLNSDAATPNRSIEPGSRIAR